MVGNQEDLRSYSGSTGKEHANLRHDANGWPSSNSSYQCPIDNIIIIAMMKSYILKSIVQVSLNPSDPSLGGFDWRPHLAHGSTAGPTTRQFRFNLTTFRQLFLFSLPQPHKDENRLIHTGLPVTKRQTDAFTATDQTLHNNCFLVEHNPVSCVLRQLSQQ